MSAANFKLEIDWAGNGSFTAAGSDVTTRLHFDAGVGFSRGKDRQRGFSPPRAGELTATLQNQSRDYSPGNSSGPLYGLIVPGRRVRLTTTSPARTLWTGFTDEITQHPEQEIKTVEFAGLGVLSRLQGKSVSTALYENIRVDQAIGYLLDAIGWPAAERTLSTATATLAWWCLDNKDAASAMLSLLLTEGPYASVYEGGNGNFVFEGNDYRSTATRSTTSQATFSTTATGNPLNIAFGYEPNYKDVISSCRVTQIERQLHALAPIWQYGAILTLAANETKKFEIHDSDPFLNACVPSAAPSSAVQTLAPTAALTSGTFKLRFRGLTTSALNWNATAAQIQAALESLSTIGVGNVLCDGGAINTTAVIVSFMGALGGTEIADLIEVVENTLNPVSVSASIEAGPVRDGEPPFLEIQSLMPSATLTAGSFVLTVESSAGLGATASISYNATALQIQTALRAISGYAGTNCYGGPISTSQVTVVFPVTENMDLMLVSPSGLSASVAGASITVTQDNMGGVPDYTLTSGSLVSKRLDRTSGYSCLLTLVAGAAGATLTGLQVRAQRLSVLNTLYVSYPTDGIIDIQGLGYSPDICPEISLTAAEALTAAIYNRHHNAIPSVDWAVYTPLSDATAVDAILAREISDRVTVVDAQTGISEDFWIERITHHVDPANGILRSQFGGESTSSVSVTPSVKKFRALISQSGTAAPTATVLQNELGGTVVWSRTSAGRYVGTLAGAFPASRSLFFVNSIIDPTAPNVAAVWRIDDNSFNFTTGSQDDLGHLNDGLLARPVELEILVYTSAYAGAPAGKLYRARMIQSGLTPPTPMEVDNNFIGGLTWNIESDGVYFATTPNGFNVNQTLVLCNSLPDLSTSLKEAIAYFSSGRLYVNTGIVDTLGDAGNNLGIMSSLFPVDLEVWESPGTAGELAGVKVYRAIISQSGTSAPAVVTTLGNSLGGTPTFGRTAAGQYTITLSNAFTANKTFIKISGVLAVTNSNRLSYWRVDASTLALRTGKTTTGYADGLISGSIGMEILVYP